MEMANNILAQIRLTKNKKASSTFAATNLSERTFRPPSSQVKRKEVPTALGAPPFIDDATRREEINVHAQTLYQQQQLQQQEEERAQDARQNEAYLQAQQAKQQAAAAAHSSFRQQQVPQKPMSSTEMEAQQRDDQGVPQHPGAPTRTASAAAAAALFGMTPQQAQTSSGSYSPTKAQPPPTYREQDKLLQQQQRDREREQRERERERDRDSYSRPDRFERPPSSHSLEQVPSRPEIPIRESSVATLSDTGAGITSRPTDVYAPIIKPPLPPTQQQQQVVVRTEPPPPEPASPPPMVRKRIGLEDFNFLAVLGKGNFGKVMLAEAKKTRQLYAIKVLKKEFIVENDEVESTRSEKRVFLIANKDRHPFLLNLHSCFQTETRIYFVMEYISGGDLMLQIQRESFKPRRAQYYDSAFLANLDSMLQRFCWRSSICMRTRLSIEI